MAVIVISVFITFMKISMKYITTFEHLFEKHFSKLKAALISLYCYLKVSQFFEARSLFIDEANLARNIAKKGYLSLFSNLDYEQYAPPIFLVLSKLSCELIGYNEYGLRLIPLLISIVNLLLILMVFEKLKSPKITILITLLFLTLAWNPMVYGTQFKQYGADLFSSLILFLVALNSPIERMNWKIMVKLSLIGSILIYTSMSSVFILFSVGFYYFIESILTKNYKPFLITIPAYVLWASAFILYYYSVLHNDIGNDHLNRFHSDYFLLLPNSFQSLEHNFVILSNYFTTYLYIGKGLVFPIFIISIVGMIQLIKKNHLFLIFYIPILLCIIASLFQQYSLIPRLLFFATIGFYLALGEALLFIYSKRKIGFWTSIIMGSILFLNPKLYLNLRPNTFYFEQTKEAME